MSPSVLADGDYVIAIDIGGTFIRVGHASLSSGEVHMGGVTSTEAVRNGRPVEMIASVVAAEMARVGRPPAGVVLGIPGLMDEGQRTVVDTPNVKSLRGVPLADLLERECRLPVWLEHDAALLTRGEHARGSARGYDSVLGVYFGTGIGGAFLWHGEPMPPTAYRMQIGHIPVRGDGRLCSCGAIDCIEPYASGLALLELASRHDTPIERIFSPQNTDDSSLSTSVRQFVRDQAIAAATAITLFDPGVVLIGGGVPAMEDYPIEDLRSEIRRRLSPARANSHLVVVPAALGPTAVLHGAASLVVNRGEGRNAFRWRAHPS